MIDLLFHAVAVSGVAAFLFAGLRRRQMRGRYLTRPLIRRLGIWGAFAVRFALVLSWIPLVAALGDPGYWVWAVLYAAPAWDDALTGGGDDRKRDPLAAVRRWLGALRPLDYSTSTA